MDGHGRARQISALVEALKTMVEWAANLDTSGWEFWVIWALSVGVLFVVSLALILSAGSDGKRGYSPKEKLKGPPPRPTQREIPPPGRPSDRAGSDDGSFW